MQGTRVVFVGGPSGTGKTTLITSVCALHRESNHVIASELLRDEVAHPERPRRFVVANDEEAAVLQKLLVERFRQVRTAAMGNVFLDGHFVVPMATGFYPVPPAIFAALTVEVLVLIESRADEIVKRLRYRGGAGWWDGTFESIEQLTVLECQQATTVARALNLPLHRIDSRLGADQLVHSLAASIPDSRRSTSGPNT